ncbi:MAG: tRNA pseudouridine(38-40) synthase TruA [Armatimonadetes bacterium]|nr:tRNA pseudouridine(38-40) synthase TruA [Armatimonadota bacterium]
MRKLKLTVQYDGTDFAGYQRQPNAATVQETLEDCLSRCLGHPVSLTAASRTDAGVHALGQVVCLETEVGLPLSAAPTAFTSALPSSVAVIEAEEVDAAFHPRFDARGKQYVYRVVSRPVRSPFLGRYAWCVPYGLEPERMRAGAANVVGRRDFRSFCAAGGRTENAVRDVTRLDITCEGDLFEFRIEADGFLYKMVRNIVGTLVEVGRDRMAPEQVGRIIEARDRRAAPPTAPPQGLCLVRVDY